jgi:hypothetical protein
VRRAAGVEASSSEGRESRSVVWLQLDVCECLCVCVVHGDGVLRILFGVEVTTASNWHLSHCVAQVALHCIACCLCDLQALAAIRLPSVSVLHSAASQ